MDIEELIIETLRLCEHIELDHEGPPRIFTCLTDETSLFSEVVLTGELCVCAHSRTVAVFLFFLINGIFDHAEHRLEWYTQELEQCINLEYDDITPETAIKLWTEHYETTVKVQEHNINQPIIVHPMERSIVTLTPSICDIWTLPRIRRQFTD